jgi:hypothetical protein
MQRFGCESAISTPTVPCTGLHTLVVLTVVGAEQEVLLLEAQERLDLELADVVPRLHHHVTILSHPEGQWLRTVLRVGSIETRALAHDLREDGFEVVWPAEKPWPR